MLDSVDGLYGHMCAYCQKTKGIKMEVATPKNSMKRYCMTVIRLAILLDNSGVSSAFGNGLLDFVNVPNVISPFCEDSQIMACMVWDFLSIARISPLSKLPGEMDCWKFAFTAFIKALTASERMVILCFNLIFMVLF